MTLQDALSAPSQNIDAQIGRRVHQLMWDRSITQTAFADRIGMDQSSVAKRLRGKLGWSATQVKQAAETLATSVSYLYGETDDSRPINPDGGNSQETHDKITFV